MGEDAPMTIHRLAGLIRDGSLIGGAVSVFLTFTSVLVWSAYGEELIRVSGLATAEDVGELRESVRHITGENGILLVDQPRSFVKEPVYRGDPVQVVLFARRVPAAASCIFTSGASVFEDETGQRLSGSEIQPRRQMTQEMARLPLTLMMPPGLDAGRIALVLELQYNCGGEIRFDRTPPIVFRILERDR